MVKVLFICHGNICRSVMAEFVFKDMIKRKGLEDIFTITSAATSYEEVGSDIYPPVKQLLKRYDIPYTKHLAHRITDSEFEEADYIVCMDSNNLFNMNRRFGENKKVTMLLNRSISDPWYTDDFDSTYNDLMEGLPLLLDRIMKEEGNNA